MKKWVGPLLSLLVIVGLIALFGPFRSSNENVSAEEKGQEHRLIYTQDKKDDDSTFVQTLKGFQGILDGWLKSLNERIESEDVTRLEVRFLEILRSILEWVKEQVDSQIESLKNEKERRERGKFREIHERFSPSRFRG